MDVRWGPFREFLFTTYPNQAAGAILIPSKLGIAYCQVLSSIMERSEPWPGLIKATLWDSRPGNVHRIMPIGSINIVNSPEVSLLLNISSASRSSVSSPILDIPSALQKRWLKCWANLFLLAVRFPVESDDNPMDYMMRHLYHGPAAPRQPVTFHLNCLGNIQRTTTDRL